MTYASSAAIPRSSPGVFEFVTLSAGAAQVNGLGGWGVYRAPTVRSGLRTPADKALVTHERPLQMSSCIVQSMVLIVRGLAVIKELLSGHGKVSGRGSKKAFW
jgi:hypothetical protein